MYTLCVVVLKVSYNQLAYHITLCCEDAILYCLNAHPPDRQSTFLIFLFVVSFINFFTQPKICNFDLQLLT